METQATELADYLYRRLESTPPNARLIVGLCGRPGSGKSSLANLIIKRVNEKWRSQNVYDHHEVAILVEMDGWHFSRSQLDAFPAPDVAHEKRGAHWTFDVASYVAFVRSLREDLETTLPVKAPSFDHNLKDPTPDGVTIYSHHRIVLIEGLYTSLSTWPWSEAAEALDERWFLEVPTEEAHARIIKRHVATGITKTLEEAVLRSAENDTPSLVFSIRRIFRETHFNLDGEFLVSNMLQPTRVILSVTDPTQA